VKLLHKGLGTVVFAFNGANMEATSSTSIQMLRSFPNYATYVQKDYFDLAGLT